jgi:CheY-like chemotaxis protein
MAWALLSAGLIATIYASVSAVINIEAEAKREFEFVCSQIELRIDARMDAHEQILISAAALFDTSDGITREQWHNFVLQQKVEQHLPGVQGIGFSLFIPRERLAQHIQEIRSQGFPDYNVRPEGDRESYTSIIYLEPFDPFCIAVIDMRMPGMDGETLGSVIRADKRLAGTRMVLLTSVGTRGDARRSQQIGFSAYATKPIRHRELKAVLSMALAEQDGIEPKLITTRHSAREKMNLFIDRKARILLAEDDITNRLVALGILKKLGLSADAVPNGAEALIAIQTKPYDLVLMDVNMPVMNGIEATKRIRNYELLMTNIVQTDDSSSSFVIRNSSFVIPIIAMTAKAMQGDRELCMEAGMNDYITKPVSPQALVEVLEKWLPKDELDHTEM